MTELNPIKLAETHWVGVYMPYEALRPYLWAYLIRKNLQTVFVAGVAKL